MAVSRILVVTAVAAERDAVLAGLRAATATATVDAIVLQGRAEGQVQTAAGLVDVIVGGVGPVAAAVSATRQLAAGYDLVLAAGIAGGFAPAAIGDVVVADAVVHADLGVDTEAGFTSMAELGWGEVVFPSDPTLVAAIADRTGAIRGTVLSLSAVTGTARRRDALLAAHPGAAAEAMEGIGICRAAQAFNIPFAEIRAISNAVGPRDRDAWRIDEALAALGSALGRLTAAPLPSAASR
ncbi:MAG: futalosine hydrolase [Frankiales bacterium]|nr:futalosine hydrolase [Frankiales bacterium]